MELNSGKRSAFDADYPDSLPYASIAITRKGAARALMILGKVEDDELHWISADRAVLVTRNGRLTRTFGLPENILRTEFSDPDYFRKGGLPQTNPTANIRRRVVDFSPGNRYAVVVNSSLELAGEEIITIGKRQHQTWRYEERCSAAELGWQCINSYWLDAQGTPWRTTQTIGPQSAPMILEITKPFAG